MSAQNLRSRWGPRYFVINDNIPGLLKMRLLVQGKNSNFSQYLKMKSILKIHHK